MSESPSDSIGRLATLQGFIKGKTEAINLATFGRASKTKEQEEFNGDSDMSGTTYWFSKMPEGDPWLPGLTKKQRIIGFFTFLILGVFCFGMTCFRCCHAKQQDNWSVMADTVKNWHNI